MIDLERVMAKKETWCAFSGGIGRPLPLRSVSFQRVPRAIVSHARDGLGGRGLFALIRPATRFSLINS